MTQVLFDTIAMEHPTLNYNSDKKKNVFVSAPATSGSTTSPPSLYLFEEEVANLLADLRDKVQQSGIPNKTRFDGNRRFPNDSSNLTTIRKRKASDDDEEEYLYEDDVYADEIDNEWRDEFYEEDDDEWMEGRSENGVTSPISNSRIPRKKAPSGTACEKHKRWKKRCPDDCPMRKPKNRRTTSEISAPTARKPLPKIHHQPEEHDYMALFQMSMMQTKKELPSVFVNGIYPEEISRTPSPDSEGDVVADEVDGRKRMRRITKPRYDDMIEDEDAFDLKDSDGSTPSSPDISYRSKKQRSVAKQGRTGRKYLPSACDRHKLLHAKCPANCPDRIRRDAELAEKLNKRWFDCVPTQQLQ